MKFRCANDIFGYCAGEPESIERPQAYYYTDITANKAAYTGMANSCLRDRRTCALSQTFAESVEASGLIPQDA